MTTIATADLYDERGDALDSLALQLTTSAAGSRSTARSAPFGATATTRW
jgi:hypothetical protein